MNIYILPQLINWGIYTRQDNSKFDKEKEKQEVGFVLLSILLLIYVCIYLIYIHLIC